MMSPLFRGPAGLGSPFKGLGSPFKGPGSPFKGLCGHRTAKSLHYPPPYCRTKSTPTQLNTKMPVSGSPWESTWLNTPCRMGVPMGGGGGVTRGQFRRGEFRKGRISPPPGILKLAHGGLWMVPDISWWALDGSSYFQCIPVTQPLHFANKHIFVPSLHLVHRCTCLNSQYSPASEFTVKLLVTRCEISLGGKFRHFS